MTDAERALLMIVAEAAAPHTHYSQRMEIIARMKDVIAEGDLKARARRHAVDVPLPARVNPWQCGYPPGESYPGIADDFEVRFTVGGVVWHRRRVPESDPYGNPLLPEGKTESESSVKPPGAGPVSP